MAISVKSYTNRHLMIAILLIMAIWAGLFYAVLMDEVYDNIDDGLKNQKIEIIREAYNNSAIIDQNKVFGINQFRILPTQDHKDLDKNVFSREFIYMPYDEEEEPYRILKTGFYSQDGLPYLLEIRTSTVEEDDFLINLAISLSILYLVIIISIIIINQVVLTRIWKPFKEILRNLSAYRFAESSPYTYKNTQVMEFDELNFRIEEMLHKNQLVFLSQKKFIENASHELQTPLAITIGKLDLLLQDPTLQESQINKLAEAKQGLHRMVKLNKSLLMLSRIENDQYKEIEKVNFNQLLQQLVVDFEDILQFKNIQLSLKEDDTFVVDFNHDLALILISNLLRNAIRYNKDPGEIDIHISKNEIIIANQSSSEALNPDYIFERFYKGNQDPQANGLGLSIVQSILLKYPNLNLDYSYVAGKHYFRIKNT
ncbi:sensor histidine kinase [Sphingobacterium sp. HJSM2_6]|uniref:sensor histidine kinase n=1 Tax=Sphingobacterium sp. HJSM2_6 TaxID=3366264 RepID=UPI003BE24EFE